MRFTGWNPASPQYRTLKRKKEAAKNQFREALRARADAEGYVEIVGAHIAHSFGTCAATLNSYVRELEAEGVIETQMVNRKGDWVRCVRFVQQ